MRYRRNGLAEAEAQVEATPNLLWDIIGQDHDWDELQVWVDAWSDPTVPDSVADDLQPDWLYLYQIFDPEGKREPLTFLTDSNVIMEINPTGQEHQVSGFVYMDHQAGGTVMEVTDWDVDSSGFVSLIQIDLSEGGLFEALDSTGALQMLAETDPEAVHDAMELLRDGRLEQSTRAVIIVGETLGWDLIDPDPIRIDAQQLRDRWYDRAANPRPYIEHLNVEELGDRS